MSAESLACHINSCRATAPSQRAPGQHAFSTSTWQQSTGINKLKLFSLFFFLSNSQMLIVPLLSYSSWSALHVGWEKVLYFLVHSWNIYYKMIWFLLFFMEMVLYFLFSLLLQKGESADHLHIWTFYTKYRRFVLQRNLRYAVYLPYNCMRFTISWECAFVNHFY